MRFEYPHLLWLWLLVVPAMVLFFWWAWQTRQRLISQFVQSRLLANLTVGVSAQRQKMRMGLLVLAGALLVLVLARPQWGFTWEEAKQRGLDVVVAIDTSRSMLASDVHPNRLARAKLAAIDLKKLARTDRVGLVAFAGTAFLQCPLSFDDEVFRQSLNALDATIIPQGGTALAEAIQAAAAAFKEKNDNHKILVLFSDGEDHDGNAVEAARAAAKEGLRIFTIGIGTANGELLRVTDEKGRSDYVRDGQGNVVKSRLNEQLLQDIAKAGNGFYMFLTGANAIELLYERGLAPLPKAERSAQRVQHFHERYQWFLGLVIVLLLLEMFLPERKQVVRTEAIASAPNPELRKAVTVLLCLMLPAALHAGPSASSAYKKYQSGRYDSALYEYQKLLKEKPADARLHFNAGTAAYRAKDFEEAQKQLNSALFTEDLQLQQRAYYNLGNTQYRLGAEVEDLSKRQQSWEQALSSYDSALKLNPKDAEAKYNQELVKQKLEELKQQQQQQQNQQNKDDQNKKDDSKQDQQQKDQQQKDDQKKQDQQDQSKQDNKQEQQKQQDQQQQQQKQDQQQQQQQPEQDQAQKNQPQQGEKKDGEKQDQKAGQARQVIQMTPEQAERLLDTIKNEEKAMLFIPQLKTNRQDRVFKDW